MNMNNIMDFWRNEWNDVTDTSDVTGVENRIGSKNLWSGAEIKGGWYKDECGDIKWTECKNLKEWTASRVEGSFLGSAVVNINGSLNETLGTKQKGDAGYDGRHTNGYIDGEGAVTAEVMVYGPNGENDVKTYTGFTMSSNAELFGAIADGTFSLNYDPKGKSGALTSHWSLNNRGNVDALNGNSPNPNSTLKGTPYKDGIFIHTTNRSGYAGTYYDKNNILHGISEGCILIIPSCRTSGNGWDEFNIQLEGVNRGTVILTRTE